MFTPEQRNARHQRYCGLAPCKAASKRASQAKWPAKPESRDYHCGPGVVAKSGVPPTRATAGAQGDRAAGSHHADIAAYGEERWLGELADRLKKKDYRPEAVKRV